jgi:hypothetical protein
MTCALHLSAGKVLLVREASSEMKHPSGIELWPRSAGRELVFVALLCAGTRGVAGSELVHCIGPGSFDRCDFNGGWHEAGLVVPALCARVGS